MRAGALGLAVACLVWSVGCTKPLERIEPPADDPATGGSGVAGSPADTAAINAPATDENAPAGTVLGKVSQTGPTLLVIDNAEGRRFWLQISDRTVITRGGQRSSALAIREGTEVHASFATDRGQRVVLRADILSGAAQ